MLDPFSAVVGNKRGAVREEDKPKKEVPKKETPWASVVQNLMLDGIPLGQRAPQASTILITLPSTLPSGRPYNYRDLEEAIWAVPAHLRRDPLTEIGFLLHRQTIMQLQTETDAAGRPLWQQPIGNSNNGSARILGHPVYQIGR